jgi:predicted GNAT family acetyltransferase
MAITVSDDPALERFEISVDGSGAGFAQYRLRPGLIAFIHTEIEKGFEGQGLASRLIAEALESARTRNLAVLPFCPFVNTYIREHPEYLSLVPESYRAQFDL